MGGARECGLHGATFRRLVGPLPHLCGNESPRKAVPHEVLRVLNFHELCIVVGRHVDSAPDVDLQQPPFKLQGLHFSKLPESSKQLHVLRSGA